jgi:hypothetical protein
LSASKSVVQVEVNYPNPCVSELECWGC